MKNAMRVLLVFLAFLVPGTAAAQDLSALTQPGAVALMRHALAPGTGDPDGFDLDDCRTQRNLDDRGRAQASRIGEAMRSADVSFDAVWTSQWCRCRDTARLVGMGPPQDVASLNSHFAGRGDRAAQTRSTRRRIASQPADARLLLVTHQVNISALTGEFARSGEIIVVRREQGALTVVDRIMIAP